MTLDEGTYYLPLLSLLRKAAERCTCGSFVRSLPAMELPSSQTPFCASSKGRSTHNTHTHMHTHTRSADGGPVSDLQGRLSKTSLAANLLTHTQIHTHIHTNTLSLPFSFFPIIAHDARTINESSTVNKKGENKTLCGALLTVVEVEVEVEVEVGEEEERRRKRSSRGRQKNSLGIDIGLSPERYLYSFYSLSFFRATCCCCCDHRSSMGDSTGNHFVELPNNAGPAGSVADQQLSDTVRPIEAPCCCCCCC